MSMVDIMSRAYEAGLAWIIREKGGPNGGWPPRDVAKVAGWAVVRILAAISGVKPAQVACDVIELSSTRRTEP